MALAWARSWEVSTTADSSPLRASSRLAGHLGDGADQHVGLVQALLGGADGHGGEAALARGELFPGRGGGVLHEGEPLLGLADVVGDLDQRALGVLGAQLGQRLFRAGNLGVGLRGPGADGGQGLRGVLLQLPQRIEVGLLLLERGQGGLGTADDLAQPAALLLLGVRNVVVELLLQLEGLRHVALGLLQRLGEVADGGIAVLGLRRSRVPARWT